MGKTRVDMPKIRNQCYGCGERRGLQCYLGYSVLCKRQSTKPCSHYRRPSLIEAARELAQAAGIDLDIIN